MAHNIVMPALEMAQENGKLLASSTTGIDP
jgi:hypothetical protein